MEGDLFSKPARYTIDTSSLIDIFGTEKMVSREFVPGLWKKISEWLEDGSMISHVEVLKEIRKDGRRGDALYEWAQAHSDVFKDYDWTREGRVIRGMSPMYEKFVDAKIGAHHADPWLVAQAKVRGLILVSEEKRYNGLETARAKIPNVCEDAAFAVKCIDLTGLVRDEGWTFS